MDTIRDRLAWARKQRGWSKRKLVRELEALPDPPKGSTMPSVLSYLREEDPTTPPVETITALAKLLGVREEWLAFKKGAPTEHVEALLRAQDGGAMAVQGALAGPEQGEEWGWIVELEPGKGREATRHRAALLRLARKLRDAEAREAPWNSTDARRDLLTAAHAFLAGTEAAFERAGGWDPEGTTGAERLQGARDHLLVRDLSEGGYVAWSDAALDLFSRRVYGLAERPASETVPPARTARTAPTLPVSERSATEQLRDALAAQRQRTLAAGERARDEGPAAVEAAQERLEALKEQNARVAEARAEAERRAAEEPLYLSDEWIAQRREERLAAERRLEEEAAPSAPPEPAPTSEPSPTTNRTPRGKRGGRGG